MIPLSSRVIAVDSSPSCPQNVHAVKHILVVDDDALMLKTIERALPEYRVTVAPDGDMALALASQIGRIDLVITDYLMPSMTGDELIGRLRELRPGLKALVVTGHGDILSKNDPGWWAAHAHLAKPFQIAALRDVVSQLIASR